MQKALEEIEKKYEKFKLPDMRTGDTVRVHEKVKEGSKERIQIFEGIVIKISGKKRINTTFTLRKVASGVGVEKTFFLHSPKVTKIVIAKRGKTRQSRLYYMRERTGKRARLQDLEFEMQEVEMTGPADNVSEEKDGPKKEKEAPEEKKEEKGKNENESSQTNKAEEKSNPGIENKKEKVSADKKEKLQDDKKDKEKEK